MRKTILFIFLSFAFLTAKSQEIAFSDSLKISLLTCSPGSEIYAKFGHSGLRVIDYKNKYDLVFNWGLFSFQTENFYFKFIAGKTDYMLGVHNTEDFLVEYKERNSVVWEHVLNFNKQEKMKLISILMTNYKPENRMYRYNFVFDNCATRPRDLIINSVDGHILFQSTYESKTFRQSIENYVNTSTWPGFGIDIIFGIKSDRNMPQLESMFLPEVLKYEVMSAQISNVNQNSKRPLILETNTLVTNIYTPEEQLSFADQPFYVFSAILIFILLLSVYEVTLDKPHNTIFDSILLLLTGLGGVIVFYLMFFSLHPLVKYNFNILWLNPLNIIAAFLIWSKKLRIVMFFYQLVNFSLLILALVAVALSMQLFNQSTFIIIAILLFRYSTWIYRTKKKIVRKKKFQQNVKQS